MVKPVRERLPSTKDILEQAKRELLREYGVSDLSELVDIIGASKAVVELERRADSIYRLAERNAIRGYLIDRGLSQQEANKMIDLILDEKNLTKEISNIRRARAGKTVEKILMEILSAYNIPCERGKRIQNYRPDIVAPDNQTLLTYPHRAVAIAVKRTLRERWAEDIDVFRFPNGGVCPYYA